jgi:hypothetical protein
MSEGELFKRIPVNAIHWGFLLFALILLFSLIRFLVAYFSRSVSASKESRGPITELDLPPKPIDPDEDGPGTYGGPYNRHPKYPPGGGS